MFVEFVGSPGAGKTTIMKRLGELLQDTQLPLVSFDEYQRMNRKFGEKSIMKKWRFARWIALAPLCWRRPKLMAGVTLLALMHGRPMLRRVRKAQKVLAHVMFVERLQARYPEKIVAHHDGFTQCLWSMLIDSRALRGRRMIQSIMRDYYGEFQPLLVALEADDALVTSRVFARTSRGRFNENSSEVRRAEFGHWLEYHRELMSFLPRDLNIYRFDASAPSDTVARLVLDALAKAQERPP